MPVLRTIAILAAAAAATGLWKATPADAGEGGVAISRDEDRPASPGPAETFTGEVSVKPLFNPNSARDIGSAEVSFTPCDPRRRTPCVV